MKYGWLRDNPDFRDYEYTQTFGSPKPEQAVDLRPHMPPVYDQGQLGSCTANALAGALEFERMKQRESETTSSRLFIYYQERVIEGTVASDAGAALRDGIKAINKVGAPPESVWPYVVTKFSRKPSAAAYKQAPLDKALAYASVSRDATLEDLRVILTGGNPVVFGFTVYSDFESDAVAASGVVPMPSKGDSVLGGHAVVAVGYTPEHIICRNSWGSAWGDKGYFYMPYQYLANSKLASDFWTVSQVS